MCGRYAIGPVPGPAWADINEAFGREVEAQLAALKPMFNIAPTMQIPIIVQDRGTREITARVARWGLVPHWWKELKLPSNTINARSEEAAVKPVWRDAWQFARCLIPATHWYEWRQEAAIKQPFALQPRYHRLFCFAGLYAWWTPPGGNPILSAAILTRAAAPALKDIHDRMPVVLNANVWREWLDPDLRDAAKVQRLLDVSAILDVVAYKVRTLVNSAKNDGPELLAPM